MASLHGTNAVCTLDDSTGANPVDIKDWVNDIGPELAQVMHDITTLGHTATVETPGLKSGKCMIKFISNTTIIAQLNAIYAAQTPGSSTSFTLVFGPAGSVSGKPRFTAELFLITYPIPAVVNNIEEIQTQWTVTNGWTLDTY